MEPGCRDCAAELVHCHGALILHHGQAPQCTDDGCPDPAVVLHTFRIDCDAVGCGCAVPALRVAG